MIDIVTGAQRCSHVLVPNLGRRWASCRGGGDGEMLGCARSGLLPRPVASRTQICRPRTGANPRNSAFLSCDIISHPLDSDRVHLDPSADCIALGRCVSRRRRRRLERAGRLHSCDKRRALARSKAGRAGCGRHLRGHWRAKIQEADLRGRRLFGRGLRSPTPRLRSTRSTTSRPTPLRATAHFRPKGRASTRILIRPPALPWSATYLTLVIFFILRGGSGCISWLSDDSLSDIKTKNS